MTWMQLKSGEQIPLKPTNSFNFELDRPAHQLDTNQMPLLIRETKPTFELCTWRRHTQLFAFIVLHSKNLCEPREWFVPDERLHFFATKSSNLISFTWPVCWCKIL